MSSPKAVVCIALTRPPPAIVHKCTKSTHLRTVQSKPRQILR